MMKLAKILSLLLITIYVSSKAEATRAKISGLDVTEELWAVSLANINPGYIDRENNPIKHSVVIFEGKEPRREDLTWAWGVSFGLPPVGDPRAEQRENIVKRFP